MFRYVKRWAISIAIILLGVIFPTVLYATPERLTVLADKEIEPTISQAFYQIVSQEWRDFALDDPSVSVILRLKEYHRQITTETHFVPAQLEKKILQLKAQLEIAVWKNNELRWKQARTIRTQDQQMMVQQTQLQTNPMISDFQLQRGVFDRRNLDEKHLRQLLFAKGLGALHSELQQLKQSILK